MGDYLAEWLFMKQSNTTGQERQYNAVGERLRERLARIHREQRLRLWICVDEELLGLLEFRGYLPFECLEHNRFLPVRVVRGVVSREDKRLFTPTFAQPLEVVDSKLRVLLVYANPDADKVPPRSPYPHMRDLYRHFEALYGPLDPLVYEKKLFIESLRNPTPEKLKDGLTRVNPHVLVFVGHGYGSISGGLVLIKDGAPEPWPFPELVKAIKETPEPALSLVVFIACQSFAAAPSLLVAVGVPAVEAMQPLMHRDFPERSVPVFAGAFFGKLAYLSSITDAHTAACRALEINDIPASALMPILWLATAEDRLFASPQVWSSNDYLEALLGKPEVALLPLPGVEGGVKFGALYVDQTVVEKRKKRSVSSEHVVKVNLWEALKEHRRIKVEAPARMGKSTFCQWVVQNCFGQIECLPILIDFRDFAQSGKSIQQYLDEDYTDWLALRGHQIEVELTDGSKKRLSFGEWLFDRWQAGGALLILDGADKESDRERRDKALASLPATKEHKAHPYVLLTSRPLGDEGPLGFKKLELKEFEPKQIENLVRRFGKVSDEKEKAKQFVKEIHQPGKVRELQQAVRPGYLVRMFATYVREGTIRVAEEAPRKQMEGGQGIWKYLRLRPWALASLVIMLLLVMGGVGYYLYQQFQPPAKVIILVANFDGPKPQEYRVTETVLARLRTALEPYNDVRVKALGRAITEAEGSTIARAEGKKRKATIVIWGWYGVTAEAVPLSVNFEMLRPPKYMPILGPEVKGQVQVMAIAELERFPLPLQTRLSAEMAYLSLFTLGVARYEAKDWNGTISRFRDSLNQTIEQVPALDRSIVHFYRGTAYAAKGDYNQAIADYDQTIKLKPDLVVAYHNRGVAYYSKGDYNRALADSDQAIKLKPDYAEAYNNRGNTFNKKDNHDRAIADYDQAVRLKPDYAEAYFNRGLSYADKGECDQATADYNQSIKLKPDFAEAYNNRGNTYRAKGDYDRAITDLDRAIKLKPDYATAYNNRGNVYYNKGDYNRAVTDYSQAIKLKPDYAVAYSNRGNIYNAKSNYDRAIADLDQAIKLKPDFAVAFYNRGNSYKAKGDYDRAITDYDQAIKFKPDYAEAYNNRGGAYILKSEKEKAIADFRKVLELSNDQYWRRRAEEQLEVLEIR
jgi:tetratricopeptide (TPR) repeat protein